MIKFVVGKPALIVDENLVIGDLHIGLEEKLAENGINIEDLSKRMGAEARMIFDESKAKRIVILGDVKESITYPTRIGYSKLRDFFSELKGIEIIILKGNHDAHINEVLKLLRLDYNVEKELLLKEAALLHGHSYPSEDALKKKYLIMAHGHAAYGPIGGSMEKIWIIAESRKKHKLILIPAFNPIITGSNIRNWDTNTGMFRAGSFNINTAKVFNLDGKLLGLLGELAGKAKIK